jgi:hypothetical protein
MNPTTQATYAGAMAGGCQAETPDTHPANVLQLERADATAWE